MQISSVSPNFQGRRDRIDELISLDDASVQRIAYMKTMSHADEKKHRRITNGLIMAAPVAAGLATAAFTKGNTKIFSKEVSGLAAKLANGLKVGGLWAASLGAVGLVGMAKNELSKASPEVRKFDKDHPLLSLATLFAAGLGAIALVNKGAIKLGSVKAPKFMQSATEKVAKFLNKNKQITSVKNGVKNLSAKTPEPLKNIGASVLSWAPQILLLGGVFHSISHGSAVNREFAKNYNELKEKQLDLAKARQRELAMENDFLKTDAQNREDLALVKQPLTDLPDEVIEKIDDINSELSDVND